jgi:predicted amino acid racemase
MYLDVTLRRNRALVDCAFELHQSGAIFPDTYVIDLDAVVENGSQMIREAQKYQVMLFVMTKQYGRNPIVTQELMKLGFHGAVVVDYKEARVLHQHQIPIGHIGHLVQIPSGYMDEVIGMNPGFITVYSVEKAREVDEACRKRGRKQNVFLRIISDEDVLYPGQYGGFYLNELNKVIPQIRQLSHIQIAGLTSFPCFLYSDTEKEIIPTKNVATLKKAKKCLEERLGMEIPHLNLPSAACTSTIAKIRANGGTQGEPGHGLLGSTPMHAKYELIERPAMVYVSEVSHNLGKKSYCYGGGHYRRSHLENALVGKSLESAVRVKAEMPDPHSIDYHIGLNQHLTIGDTVIMAFRSQVFVTRSDVAVVKGLSNGNPELVGIFDSLGKEIGR